jgi:very-short-patch-repair endonuclease
VPVFNVHWSKQTNKKYIFNCNICLNEFTASCNNIYNNKRCSHCKNKTEKKLNDILKTAYTIIIHPIYKWCKNSKTNRYLQFDFECNNNIIIELDGLQHFKQIWNWKSPEEQVERDKYKMDYAIKNNKHVIRLFQEDVYYDRNNWKEQLFNAINELLNKTIPTIRYINIDPKHFE